LAAVGLGLWLTAPQSATEIASVPEPTRCLRSPFGRCTIKRIENFYQSNKSRIKQGEETWQTPTRCSVRPQPSIATWSLLLRSATTGRPLQLHSVGSGSSLIQSHLCRSPRAPSRSSSRCRALLPARRSHFLFQGFL